MTKDFTKHNYNKSTNKSEKLTIKKRFYNVLGGFLSIATKHEEMIDSFEGIDVTFNKQGVSHPYLLDQSFKEENSRQWKCCL